MKKICPIMSYRNEYSPTSVWCCKRDCAWWDQEQGCCFVITKSDRYNVNEMPIVYGPYC